MKTEQKVLQALANAAVEYYRTSGAGEHSDRQVNTMHRAAKAYLAATVNADVVLHDFAEAYCKKSPVKVHTAP